MCVYCHEFIKRNRPVCGYCHTVFPKIEEPIVKEVEKAEPIKKKCRKWIAIVGILVCGFLGFLYFYYEYDTPELLETVEIYPPENIILVPLNPQEPSKRY